VVRALKWRKMLFTDALFVEESSQKRSRNARDVSSRRIAGFSAAPIADILTRSVLQWLIFLKLYGGR